MMNMMKNGKDNCPPPLTNMDAMLYPLLDLLNGERDEEYTNVKLIAKVDQDLIEVRALRDIKSGEELIVSYGDSLNLSYKGFDFYLFGKVIRFHTNSI